MQYYNYGRTWSITTDPLRGSYCVRIAITKLRSIALRFSLAWCFASFGISDACLSFCFSFHMDFPLNHNQSFPTATSLHKVFTSVTIVFQCFRLWHAFQCVDTLLIALKHAGGMSLRYDAICAPAYCG